LTMIKITSSQLHIILPNMDFIYCHLRLLLGDFQIPIGGGSWGKQRMDPRARGRV
jgi:hypothetical protein